MAENKYSSLWDIPVPEDTYMPHLVSFYSKEEGPDCEYTFKIHERVHSLFNPCERFDIEEYEEDEYRCTLLWVRFI